MYIYQVFIFIPFIIFALLFSSLLVVPQIRGHAAGSSPPLPTTRTVRALHFYREKISAVSSLVDSRRIVLTHAIQVCMLKNTSCFNCFFLYYRLISLVPS